LSTQITKQQVVSGVVWAFLERVGVQFVGLIVTIVLARLIAPSAFGMIVIATALVNFSNSLAVGGFATSLVQKKDSDDLDFSTMLSFSLSIGIVLYIILFLVAPTIEAYYALPELGLIIRITGIAILIAAYNSIQVAYVQRHMLFKLNFLSSLIGIGISGILGIGLALLGFGIWALVTQILSSQLISTIALAFCTKWTPRISFSLNRFKPLFKFGKDMTINTVLFSLVENVQSLVVGKLFLPATLAFYNRGQQFPLLFVGNINTALIKVMFPAMAGSQESKGAVKSMMRRTIKTSSFLVTPLLVGLIVTAPILVDVLLGEAWASCVPYLQLFSAGYLFTIVATVNSQAIYAIGMSSLGMWLSVIKRVFEVVALLLIIFVFRDPINFTISFVVVMILAAIINILPNRRIFSYSYREQAADFFVPVLLALPMGLVVYCISLIPTNNIVILILQVLIGGLLYFGLAKLTRQESLTFLIEVLQPDRH
jgi:O-antigen/teichoic acid export membrane protein